MRELAAARAEIGRPPTPDEIGRIAARHDIELVGPPLGP
jgi:hypothetical protein